MIIPHPKAWNLFQSFPTIRNSKPKLVAEIPHWAEIVQNWGYTKVAIGSTSVFDRYIVVDQKLAAKDLT
jgi:hypothetical protein